MDDAGYLMFGKIGRLVFGFAFTPCESRFKRFSFSELTSIDWIFVAGSGILGISIGLNAVSSHALCTAGFVAIAAFIGFSLSSIRTLGKSLGLRGLVSSLS